MSIRNEKLEQILTAIEGGGGVIPADVCRIGWGSYFNGDQTPINVPAGVETKLTLTTTGGSERERSTCLLVFLACGTPLQVSLISRALNLEI